MTSLILLPPQSVGFKHICTFCGEFDLNVTSVVKFQSSYSQKKDLFLKSYVHSVLHLNGILIALQPKTNTCIESKVKECRLVGQKNFVSEGASFLRNTVTMQFKLWVKLVKPISFFLNSIPTFPSILITILHDLSDTFKCNSTYRLKEKVLEIHEIKSNDVVVYLVVDWQLEKALVCRKNNK